LPRFQTICVSLGATALTTIAQPVLEEPKAERESLPDLGAIGQQVARIRQLEFLEEVPAERQSQDDFARVLERDLEASFPEAERAGMLRGLRRLGMIREEIDLAGALRDAMLTQAGAYYDPETGKFYYLMDAGAIPGGMDVIAAHELVHALQDQHHDLSAVLEPFEVFPDGQPRDDDGVLAVRSVIEGDATYVMLVFQLAQLGVDLSDAPDQELAMIRNVAGQSIETIAAAAKMQAQMGGLDPDGDIAKAIAAMDDIPPYLLEPLYAAYFKGALFCASLKQARGWAGVNEAITSPPLSMEQVLHPEKHHGDDIDIPSRVRLPDVSWLAEPGFHELDSAVLGEFYIALLLRTLGADMLDQVASQGWDGDVYAAFGRAEETLVVLATTWDGESDAREFFDVYRSVLGKKYPASVLGEVAETESGRRVDYVCGEALGVGVVVQRGLDVFIVEGADREVSDRVIETCFRCALTGASWRRSESQSPSCFCWRRTAPVP